MVKSYSKTLESLSKGQKEVYEYLTRDFLSAKQIAERRKTSLTAVYKIINKLKSYGIINKNFDKLRGVENIGGQSPTNLEKVFRLHGQRFTIEILDITNKYLNDLKKKNRSIIDNNTIFMYEKELVIYSNKDFWGYSVDNCFELSSIYWNNFIRILENDLNIILIKPRKCNIKDFGCHIAKTNDILAKEVNLNSEHLKVYAPDGKLRLIIDNSFNLNEFEAVHKESSKRDMKKVELMYKEILENDLLSPKEIHLIIQENERFKSEILVMVGSLVKKIEDLKNGR